MNKAFSFRFLLVLFSLSLLLGKSFLVSDFGTSLFRDVTQCILAVADV